MKINKTASGKTEVRLSQRDWINIGKQAGWFDKPSPNPDQVEQESLDAERQYMDDRQQIIKNELIPYLKRLLEACGIAFLGLDTNDPNTRAKYPAQFEKFDRAVQQLQSRGYNELDINSALYEIKKYNP